MDEVLQAAATSHQASGSLNSSPQRGKKRKVRPNFGPSGAGADILRIAIQVR